MSKPDTKKNNETFLIIIGGGEDKQAGQEILKHVVKISGGKDANIAVITTATNYPLEVGEEYKRIFYDLGASYVHTINIESRKEANRKQLLQKLEEINCLFFVGGDQLRISSILGGTEFHRFIKNRISEDLVIAGTSAGASMMSEVMVVEGEDEEAPRKCTVKMAPGMGFIKGVIIDQHFSQRGRIGRLLGATAQNPYALGIGIDEDTAILINKQNEIEVIGSGVITIVDGKDIGYTNISEQYPDEPLAITGVKVHILPEKFRYNLTNRETIVEERG
ncbi:cyanophycinase [Serpentinicella sp. ANB-PHB4]|uniref:cyanophycinase n=1 Tax=Serpentinicella sp. ANB-PHB4 TaxID=3074076 RepID=UPI00285C2B57|nr:cyanophycinase [Serpentinicella sp. ANB-PHB4]MDR5660072.1 cyanophycinase [Serpentinicella sp. ANB-PHB4]